ncbi:MAG: phosphoribosylglycinamide formyltransferase [Haliscomenobacter sp.]
MSNTMSAPIHVAIFASGTGSNARKLIEYFSHREDVKICLIVSNKKDAPVLQLAAAYHIPTQVIHRTYFYDTENLLEVLRSYGVSFIVLAGFLWKIPAYLVAAFDHKMVNIHPALLPAYGGQGMYGMHVHQAVWQAKEGWSGITIHFVNAHYDEGDIIFQARCVLAPGDTPSDIAHKVQALEHQYFPGVVDALLTGAPLPKPSMIY